MAKTFEMSDPNDPGSKFDIPADEVKGALKSGLTLSSRMDRYQAKVFGEESFRDNARKWADLDAVKKSEGYDVSDQDLMDATLGMGVGGAVRGGTGAAVNAVRGLGARASAVPASRVPYSMPVMQQMKREMMRQIIRKGIGLGAAGGAGYGIKSMFSGE